MRASRSPRRSLPGFAVDMALRDMRRAKAANPDVLIADLTNALQVMIMAWDSETSRDGRRYIGLGDDCYFPMVKGRIKSVDEAKAFLSEITTGASNG